MTMCSERKGNDDGDICRLGGTLFLPCLVLIQLNHVDDNFVHNTRLASTNKLAKNGSYADDLLCQEHPSSFIVLCQALQMCTALFVLSNILSKGCSWTMDIVIFLISRVKYQKKFKILSIERICKPVSKINNVHHSHFKSDKPFSLRLEPLLSVIVASSKQ